VPRLGYGWWPKPGQVTQTIIRQPWGVGGQPTTIITAEANNQDFHRLMTKGQDSYRKSLLTDASDKGKPLARTSEKDSRGSTISTAAIVWHYSKEFKRKPRARGKKHMKATSRGRQGKPGGTKWTAACTGGPNSQSRGTGMETRWQLPVYVIPRIERRGNTMRVLNRIRLVIHRVDRQGTKKAAVTANKSVRYGTREND